MEMVSTSKYKATESPLNMNRKYFEKVQSVFTHLAGSEGGELKGPYFTPNDQDPVGLLVITTDAGLCGSYNNQILRLAEDFIQQHSRRGFKLFVHGRKGQGYFKKRGIPVEQFFPAFHGRMVGNFHAPILNALVKAFQDDLVGEVHVAYTIFHNAMKRQPIIEKFLNIEKPKVQSANFIVEYGREGVLAEIVPMYLSSRLRLMFLESLTSEHSARMVAMKSAKDNAKELEGDLVLLRNKMRQAMITREVIEIISSAEALKG